MGGAVDLISYCSITFCLTNNAATTANFPKLLEMEKLHTESKRSLLAALQKAQLSGVEATIIIMYRVSQKIV